MKNIKSDKKVKKVAIDKDLYNILKAELIFHPSIDKGIDAETMQEYINHILHEKVREVGNQFSRIAKRCV